jgi:hypothetical protein
MKPIGMIKTTALFLMLGIAAPAYARQDKPDKQDEKGKPEKQEQHAKPEQQKQAKKQQDQQQQHQQQDHASKQQQQQEAKKQQDQQRQQHQQDNSAKQQQAKQQQNQQHQQQDNRSAHRRSPAQVHQQQVAWQGTRAHSWQSEHRTWQQRGGYHGYHVPDDHFRGYYGQDHGFRIYSLPVRYVGGHRRFHYGGYWFGLVDPWPEYWDTNWYDDDDVYVDYYGDGYYLYNRRYPSDRIAISFYLN